MSEYMFIQQQADEFLSAHPREEGWKVYEFSPRLQMELDLKYLVDFLRDRHPEIPKTRRTIDEVRTPDMLGEKGDSHAVALGEDWDRSKDLDTYDWVGGLEVEWQGQPIHYFRFHSPADQMPCQKKTLAAARSNAALRDLHQALARYAATRESRVGQVRMIRVINGHDIPMPNVGWEDVILPRDLGREIRDNVEAFFSDSTKQLYGRLGIPYRRGLIFTGPPGCGKTLTLKALANSTKAAVIAMHMRADIDDNALRAAFWLAERQGPAMLIFEDLDRMVRAQGMGLSYFLNLLDGLRASEGVLVIATSNHPEKLDPALIHRPSRFDRIWRFPLPAETQRRMLLEKMGGRFFSAATLKTQRKTAAKEEESLAERESIGFLQCAKQDASDETDREIAELGRTDEE